MTDQKLKHITSRDRPSIELAASSNRRARVIYERQRQRQLGPGACLHCGAESCGHLWTKPGDREPGGERCCDRCNHPAVPGWEHTHTVWASGHVFPVCALRMREGETVYLRRDGIVEFLELGVSREGNLVPSIVFHGQSRGAALYFAGEGGPGSVDLWGEAAPPDPAWLPLRAAGAREQDSVRQLVLHRRSEERDQELERLEAEHQAREAVKRERDIEQRALEHETVTVLRELEAQEASAQAALAAGGAAPATVQTLLPGEAVRPGRKTSTDRQKVARRRQLRAQAAVEARRRLAERREARKARGGAVQGAGFRAGEAREPADSTGEGEGT